MNFSELGLEPAVLANLTAVGYEQPTTVQEQAIPAALTGQDLLVSSHTGSGKTAAFLLPGLCRLAKPSAVKGKGPRILVLTPTRELALQVEKAAYTYAGKQQRLRVACLVGGMPYPAQLKQLQGPLDIVVATPGRLIDHLERGRIDFGRIEVLILDEADRMLDMGFIDDIESIVARTPATRQTLLFSATLDGVVGNLARKLTQNAIRIQIAPSAAGKADIEQRMMFADGLAHKNQMLDVLLRDVAMQQALVFTSTKRSADELSDTLREAGFAANALHGDMNQGQRNRTLKGLRDGRTRILVATDVAARGIDVAGISHVINFDAPRQAEDYVHRIGRTGRAGRSGIAVTFVHPSERRLVRDIERYTGQPVPVHTIAGLEPKLKQDAPSKHRARPHPGGAKPAGNGQGKRFAPRVTFARGSTERSGATNGNSANGNVAVREDGNRSQA
ncbi:MAG: DEAD/DEAH box helicase, partial [Burkholderiales bacterium]